jgi:hypothetical protein
MGCSIQGRRRTTLVVNHTRAMGCVEQETWEWEMNERIKELARQAGFYANPDVEKFERFAELVRQDEREQAEYDNLTVKFGERAKEYLEGAKKSWQEPVAWIKVWDEKEKKHVLMNYYITPPPKREVDMSTKPENIDTSEECVHETDKSVHDDDDIQEYKKPWVSLTDEEMENLVGFMRGNTMIDFARAIEAKLKEKNT